MGEKLVLLFSVTVKLVATSKRNSYIEGGLLYVYVCFAHFVTTLRFICALNCS